METAAISAFGVVGLAVAVTNQMARRLRLPPILIYLFVGVVAGPSVLDIFDPEDLEGVFRTSLELLVGLLVFEGAFAINVQYLRRVGRVVRNLLTIGLAVTFLSGTLLAGLLDVLPWRTAFMFGALVSVTGPTVIGPLVRSVRLNDHVRAVLLGEGVLIDPLGAILAVVVLQFVLGGFQQEPFLWVPSRLLGGAAIGLGGVLAVRGVLRLHRDPSPIDMTLLLLGMSAATLALAERALPDSGLTAMATMGVVLAAIELPHREQVRSFEDEFSRILLAAVYVLSAATLDLGLLRDLWPKGLIAVVGLMVLVRPFAVWLCTLGSDLRPRERLYIAAIAPRGVVAVALAAFAGESLGDELLGPELTALVFLTVAITVGVQSSYAALLARLLGVRAMRALIAGSGTVSRRIGAQLVASGFDVVLVDPDEEAVARARSEGLDAGGRGRLRRRADAAARRERRGARRRRFEQRRGEPAVLPVRALGESGGDGVRARRPGRCDRGVPALGDRHDRCGRGDRRGADVGDRAAGAAGCAGAQRRRPADGGVRNRVRPRRAARARPAATAAGARAARAAPRGGRDPERQHRAAARQPAAVVWRRRSRT